MPSWPGEQPRGQQGAELGQQSPEGRGLHTAGAHSTGGLLEGKKGKARGGQAGHGDRDVGLQLLTPARAVPAEGAPALSQPCSTLLRKPEWSTGCEQEKVLRPWPRRSRQIWKSCISQQDPNSAAG